MSNLKNYFFTSESVSEGHPDKVSDRISDMVVDSYISADPFARVACETLTTTNKVVLAGEVRGPEIKKNELIEKVRDCIKDIGYDQDGFTWKEATKIESHLHSQSADIAMGVDSSGNKDEGAGDQGIMFGYACDETDELMPAPIHYSHKILRLMAEDRKSGKLKGIEPDSKSQVTMLYENNKPIKVLNDQTFLTEALTDKAIDFIKRNKNNPFFLYLPHPQPHVPLFASDKFKGTQKRGLYGDVINEIDYSVGRILKTLKMEKLEENTIIIFTSDNGPWLSYGGHSGSAGIFREGKGTNWEGGHRVPGIVYYPNKIKANTKIDVPAMGIDWLPTLVEFTRSQSPKNKIDGASLVPLLTGKTDQSPHKNFFFYYRVNELHAVRHKNWKFYVPHTYRSLNGRVGTNDGFPIPYEMNTIKYPALFDLEKDPKERIDLSSKHPEIVIKISKIADSIRTILGDKLTGIKGKEVRPVGKID